MLAVAQALAEGELKPLLDRISVIIVPRGKALSRQPDEALAALARHSAHNRLSAAISCSSVRDARRAGS